MGFLRPDFGELPRSFLMLGKFVVLPGPTGRSKRGDARPTQTHTATEIASSPGPARFYKHNQNVIETFWKCCYEEKASILMELHSTGFAELINHGQDWASPSVCAGTARSSLTPWLGLRPLTRQSIMRLGDGGRGIIAR